MFETYELRVHILDCMKRVFQMREDMIKTNKKGDLGISLN
jgi:hypothetical protein